MKCPISKKPGYWNCWNRVAREDFPARRPYQNVAKIDKRRYRRMLRREARGTYFQLEHTPFHTFTLKLARNFRR